METKTIKGIVEAVNPAFNSVKIDGLSFSGKYSYEGMLPNVGDEVELNLVSSVSKKDNKTYWNITGITVISARKNVPTSDKEKSIIAQCLTKIVFGDKGGELEKVFETYQTFLTKLE